MSEPDFNDRWRAGDVTDIEDGTEPVNPSPEGSGPDAANPAGPRPVADMIGPALAKMRARARGEEKPIGTPWASLNEALFGGLWGGFYTLVSGTGVGKTQWALQIALAAAIGEAELLTERRRLEPKAEPSPVVYVGLELGDVDIVARLLGLLSGEMWSSLAFGRGGVSVIDAACRADDAEKKLAGLPIHVEIAPPRGWGTRGDIARILAMRPRLLVIDFLQLIAPQPREDARTAMSRVAYELRAFARETGAVVLALSSTARANYAATSGLEEPPGQGDPARFVGLGKESGDIEFAADGAFAIVNGPEPEPGAEGRDAFIAIAKARGGRQHGWLKFLFDGSSFHDRGPVNPTPAANKTAPTNGKSKPAKAPVTPERPRTESESAVINWKDDEPAPTC